MSMNSKSKALAKKSGKKDVTEHAEASMRGIPSLLKRDKKK